MQVDSNLSRIGLASWLMSLFPPVWRAVDLPFTQTLSRSMAIVHSEALTADPEVLTATWSSYSPSADDPNSPAPIETSMTVSAAERARPTRKHRAPLAARRPLDAPPSTCVLKVPRRATRIARSRTVQTSVRFRLERQTQHRLAWRACAQESSDSDKTVEYIGLDGAVEIQAAHKEEIDHGVEETNQAGDKGEQERAQEQEDEDEGEGKDEDAPAATRWMLPGYAKAVLVGLLASIGGAFLFSHYEADKRPIEHGVNKAVPPPQWMPLLTVMEDQDRHVSPNAELDDPEIVEILSACGTTDE